MSWVTCCNMLKLCKIVLLHYNSILPRQSDLQLSITTPAYDSMVHSVTYVYTTHKEVFCTLQFNIILTCI